MPRPRKQHTHVNLHTLRWECALHGGHTVIVAGLDSMALSMARILVENAAEQDWPCTMTSLAIPIDEARDAGGDDEDFDDLPY